MRSASTGDVVLYSYLWAGEYECGEESGRKTRPACVMVLFKDNKGRQTTLLFPITSQKPLPQTQAVEIPETECPFKNSVPRVIWCDFREPERSELWFVSTGSAEIRIRSPRE
jgi:hypothetical protein